MSDSNNKKDSLNVNHKQPGEILAAKRKKLGMDEKEAAESLKISVSRLRSLEASDFSDFPSETYIRGYLRNYGRLLKANEQEVMDAYEQSRPSEFLEAANHEDAQAVLVQNNAHKQWWLVYVVLVTLVLLWVLSYWLLGSGQDDRDVSLTPFSELNSSDTSSGDGEAPLGMPQVNSDNFQLPITLETNTNKVQSGTTDPNEKTSEENISSPDDDNSQPQENLLETKKEIISDTTAENTSEPIVVSKVTAAEVVKSVQAEDQKKLEQATLAQQGDTLTFGFDNACWIKVTDSTGKVIFVGLQSPGSQLSLNGKAPFRVVIGNVEGTTMVYNGVPVQLTAEAGRKSINMRVGG
jgi:cytoskeleton protein RodZ